MKNILVISAVNEKSPALRYRLIYTLDLLHNEKKVNYEILSFYAKDTDEVMNGNKLILKVLYMLRDLVRFMYKLTTIKVKYDVVIVKNYVFPIGGAGLEKIVRKKFDKCKFFYDIDDGIYLNKTRKQNSVFNRFRNAFEKVKFWSIECEKLMLSNEIIFKDLNEMIGIDKDKVIEFLSCPFEKQYFENYSEMVTHKEKECVNFIWLGSPHTQDNLLQCESFIMRLPEIVKNAKLFIIGAHKGFEHFRNLEYVEYVEWSMENERKYMRKSHVGLNPLVDDEFEKRKSAFKAIQYYRAGIVPIVSNVGINKRLVEQYGGYCSEKFDIVEMDNYINGVMSNYNEICCNIYNITKELTVETNKEIIENALKM